MLIQNDSYMMTDQSKSKKQLLDELRELRAQLAALESLSNEQGEITNFARPRRRSGYTSNGPRRAHVESLAGPYNLGKLALQRERAYATVRRQFDLIQAIMESLGEGVYAIDHAGHFTRMNPAAKAMLGWSSGELLGKDIHEKIHPPHVASSEGIAAEGCPLLDAWRAGETVRNEDMFTRKDGTTFPVSYVSSPIISDNQIVGCVVAFHDITARKQLECALRQSERNAVMRAGELEAIVEAMHDAILVFNREGRVIHANSSAWRFFRQDMHSSGMQLLNEHMTRYAVRDAHGNPLENADTPLFRILRGEILTNDDSVDIFIRAADGRQVEINISGAPFYGEAGEIEGAVCIVRDVTERRKEERYTREAAREALEQAAELEAILDALTDVVLVYAQDGRILRGNATAREFLARQDTLALLDLNAEERATHYDLRDADNQPLSDQDNPVIRVLGGETITGADAVHIMFRRPDGSDGQVQISGAPLRDRQGHTCGAVCVYKVVS